MLRDVELHGILAEKYQKNLAFKVRSPGDVLRALCANFKDFKNDLRAYSYVICADGEYLGLDDMMAFNMDFKKIDIIPVTVGESGVIKAVVGAVLIVAGIVLDVYSFGTLGNPMIMAGISLIANVVIQSLQHPNRTYDRSDDAAQSNIFDGPRNMSRDGVAVPIQYGVMLVGSIVVSGFTAVKGSSTTSSTEQVQLA